jgi:putative addiction module CopG family antidote
MEEPLPGVSLNVTLSEALEAFVNERVAEGDYKSPGDYVRSLIREDQERRTRETLDSLLLTGLGSDSDPVTTEYLAELRRDAMKRIDRHRKRA